MNNSIREIFSQRGLALSAYSGLTEDIQSASESEIGLYTLNQNTQQAISILQNRALQSKAKCLVLFTDFTLENLDNRFIKLNLKDKVRITTELLDHFYPIRNNLKLIGVTGTNGKTSVAYFIYQMLNLMGKRATYIGTIGILDSNGKERKINNTMPGIVELRRTFASNLDSEFFVLEATSIGLVQERLGSFKLDLAIWTNFTQDHLDYHKDMENYFQAKLKIIDCLKKSAKIYLLKSQNELQKRIHDQRPAYSSQLVLLDDNQYDHFLSNTIFSQGFMHDNMVLAMAAVEELTNKKVSNDFLLNLKSPPGRFQILRVPNSSSMVIIDYAHTPDALEKLLRAAREQYPHFKLLLVFGCGGNRDNLKRPLMGAIGEKWCDELIITSDNPRFEDPETIIGQILAGIRKVKQVHVEVDREKAICKAINLGKGQPSVVVIAGKGHETGQEIKGQVYPFSDHDLVAKLIN